MAAVIAIAFFLPVAAMAASSGESSYIENDYSIEPEYDHFMREALISLDDKVHTLEFHADLINSLPQYTELIIVLPSTIKATIEADIKTYLEPRKIRLVTFNPKVERNVEVNQLLYQDASIKTEYADRLSIPRGSVWAQDLFKSAVSSDGQRTIILPDMHKAFFRVAGPTAGNRISDNQFMWQLTKAGMSVVHTPLTFKGGNVIIDKINGRRVAFIGGDVLRESESVFKNLFGQAALGDNDVKDLVRMYFKVDEVVVLGADSMQPGHMFHLDQAMMPLGPGLMAVTHLMQLENDITNVGEIKIIEKLLAETRRELKRLGYRIVDMHTTVEDALGYRYYVNGIVYKNALNRRTEFLMPVFPDAPPAHSSQMIQKNIKELEAVGLRVIPVPTYINRSEGGLHCLINILS